MTQFSSPYPFLVAAAIIFAGVVYHTVSVYGWRTAIRLMLPILAVAAAKEISLEDRAYVSGTRLMTPFGIPLGIIGGWFIVSLLAVEFSRSLARIVAPIRGNRLPWRLFMICLFAAVASHAIEPIGQLAGWWSWQNMPFPHFASGDWGSVVAAQCALGLLVAARVTARFVAGMLGLAAAVGLGLVGLLELGLLPRTVLPAVVLLLVIAVLIQPWFNLPPDLLTSEAERNLLVWVRAIPSIGTWLIILPLAILRGSMDLIVFLKPGRGELRWFSRRLYPAER